MTLVYKDDTFTFKCITARSNHIMCPLCHHGETQSHDVTLVYKDDTLAFEIIMVRPNAA